MQLPNNDLQNLRGGVRPNPQAEKALEDAYRSVVKHYGNLGRSVEQQAMFHNTLSAAQKAEAMVLRRRVEQGLMFQRNFDELLQEIRSGGLIWAKANAAYQHSHDELNETLNDINDVAKLTKDVPEAFNKAIKKVGHMANVSELTHVVAMNEYAKTHKDIINSLHSVNTVKASDIRDQMKNLQDIGVSIEDYVSNVLGQKNTGRDKVRFDALVRALTATRDGTAGSSQRSYTNVIASQFRRTFHNSQRLNEETARIVEIMREVNNDMSKQKQELNTIFNELRSELKKRVKGFLDILTDPVAARRMAAGFAAAGFAHAKEGMTTLTEMYLLGLREQLRSGTSLPSISDSAMNLVSPTVMMDTYKKNKQAVLSLTDTYNDVQQSFIENQKGLFNTFGGDPTTMFQENAALLTLSKQSNAMGASMKSITQTQGVYIQQIGKLARYTGQEPDAIVRNMESLMADADVRDSMALVNEKQRQLMLQSNMARQLELTALGMSADKAREFADSLTKSTKNTFLERRKTAIRLQQYAALVGLDPKKSAALGLANRRWGDLTNQQQAEFVDAVRSLQQRSNEAIRNSEANGPSAISDILQAVREKMPEVNNLLQKTGNPELDAKMAQAAAGKSQANADPQLTGLDKKLLTISNTLAYMNQTGLGSLATAAINWTLMWMFWRNTNSLLAKIAINTGGKILDGMDGPNGKNKSGGKGKPGVGQRAWQSVQQWGQSALNFGRTSMGGIAAKGPLAMLGAAGAVAGAGYTGYEIGDKIARPLIDAGIQGMSTMFGNGKTQDLGDVLFNVLGDNAAVTKALAPTPLSKRPLPNPQTSPTTPVAPVVDQSKTKDAPTLDNLNQMVMLLREQNRLMFEQLKVNQKQLDVSTMSEDSKKLMERRANMSQPLRQPANHNVTP